MDRREAKEMYGQVLQQIQAGDPMAAYSIFEQMPFPDQMAMFMTPGVGDAIAAVEAGVFNERSKENFAQGNIGRGLMDAGIGGLAMASTIPFVGKAAELGSMGVRGLRNLNLRSMRGDGMSGGGGGGSRIDELNSRKEELIKDHEAMTERMPKDVARRFYPNDEINAIDEEIYSLMSTSRGGGMTPKEQLDKLFQRKKDLIRSSNERGEFFPDEVYTIDAEIEKLMDVMDNPASAVSRGQSTSRVFRNDGSVSAAEKVDGEVGRLIDQGFEGDNFMFNQDFSVPVKMQGTNRKTGEMIEIETIPSQDGNIGMTITKLDNPAMAGEKAVARDLVAANNKEQIANRIRRELELEGGDMAPATRKRLESKLNTLMREIAELRGN